MIVSANYSDIGLNLKTVETPLLGYWDLDLYCTFTNSEFASLIDAGGFLGIPTMLYDEIQKVVLQGKFQIYRMEDEIQSSKGNTVFASYSPVVEQGKVSGFYFHVAVIPFGHKKSIT